VTIPLFLKNKDVAVDASTGSGKTLAFVVPIVEMLRRLERPLKKHQVGAIVISPTRELSRQIFEVAKPFSQSLPNCSTHLLVGGNEVAADVNAVRSGAQLLIGTPGRMKDVLERLEGALDLKTLGETPFLCWREEEHDT